MRRWRLGVLVAAAVGLLIGAGTLTAGPSFEGRVVTLVNQERVTLGRSALIAEARLMWAAEGHARWMADNDNLTHYEPPASNPLYDWRDRAEAVGYVPFSTGEVLAAGQSTPDEVVLGHYCTSNAECNVTTCQSNACDGWKQSPTHWDILMDPNYTDIGVGYVYDASTTYAHWWGATVAKRLTGSPHRVARDITTTADALRSAEVADLDGDGDLDVISASYADDTVAWFENDGGSPPSWTARTITTAADGATDVFATDLDGDGDIDVLSSSELDDTVRWYENTGGTPLGWTTHTVTTVAYNVRSIYAADFDNDGDPDVVAGYLDDASPQQGGRVKWYENGNSWTARDVFFDADADPTSVFAADVNADGLIDVLSASQSPTSDAIRWHQNNGALGWTTRTIYASANSAQSVFAADVDGDGDVDALSASFGDDTVAWYENDGTTPVPGWTTRTISTAADGAQSVWAGDVDDDGDVDVVSASHEDDKIAWYENDRASPIGWTEHQQPVTADGAYAALAADLDGDGDTDLLSASELDDTLAWYENRTIHRGALYPAQANIGVSFAAARSVQAADMDQDGDVDAVGAAANSDEIAWWANGDGAGGSWTKHVVDSAFDGAQSVGVADIDGDGDPDLVGAAEAANQVAWWENTNGVGTSWTKHVVDSAFTGAVSVHAADMDADGDTDLLGAAKGLSEVAWWENTDGAGGSWTKEVIDDNFNQARAVRAADVNGDGLLDVVGAAELDDVNTAVVSWWESSLGQSGCPPTCWTERAIDDTFYSAGDVQPADMDGDGDVDVIAAVRGDPTAQPPETDQMVWWENTNGAGTSWTSHAVDADYPAAWTVYPADVDRDGDLDVVGASEGNEEVTWWENTNGAGTSWTETTIASGFAISGPWQVYPADLNRDHNLDILVALSGDGAIAWWRNRGGQFRLETTDTAPSEGIPDGGTDDLLRIDVTHLGRSGDTDVELATLDLLFEETPGDPLTTAEANAVIENLFIYLDTGSGVFETSPIVDTQVLTVTNLSLVNGVQTVTFDDGDSNTHIAHGSPKVYFVVVELTANAGQQTPHMFRVTHVTESSSTAQDRVTDGQLDLEYAPNVSSSTVPVTLAFFRATRSSDGVQFAWSTLTEVGHAGFNLYQQTADGWQRLNDRLIPPRAMDSLAPQHYTYYAAGVTGNLFRLEEVDVLARRRSYGPFAMGREYGRRPQVAPVDWAAIAAEHQAKVATRRQAGRAAVQKELAETLVRLVAPGKSQAGADVDSLGGPVGPDRRPPSQPGPAVAPVQLLVSVDGLYRVTYEDLKAAGVDLKGVPLQMLLMTHRGRPVPLRFQTPGRKATFGPGAFLEFYGQAADTLYTGTSVYLLTVGEGGPRVAAEAGRPLPPGGAFPPAAPYYMEQRTVEHQRAYSFGAPNGDPWYDTWLVARGRPASWRGTIQLDELVADGPPARLTVSLWGATDWPGGPDHHVRVRLNGLIVADERFDGLVSHPITTELPAGLLREGANTLTVQVPGDTGSAYDVVVVDSFTVTYPRRFVARDARLQFEAAGRVLRVEGLPSSDVVAYRLSDDGPVWLPGVRLERSSSTYSATLPGSSEPATYIVAAAEAIATPEIAPWRPAAVETGGRADYVIIAHPDFLGGIQPLVEARQARGLRVRVVNVEDLYAQYTGGELDPEAIRRYVAYAYRRLGARYVLLVGGDTYDYRNYLGLGSVSFIPSLYGRTDRIVRYAPLDPLYGDVDGDGVAEVAVGRFPVRTAAELAALVEKTLRYEAREKTLRYRAAERPVGSRERDYRRTALLVADASDQTVDFTRDSELLARSLGRRWRAKRIYLDALSPARARPLLLDALNGGVGLTSFVGHSSPTSWSFDSLFTAADAASLNNSGRPTVVLQWGCWNTYHVAPQYDTLAHQLLLAGDRGAAAVLGAATLTESSSERALARLLMGRLAVPGMTLGEAIQAAKAELALTQPDRRDVLWGWTLLGDPALVVH